MKQLQDYLLDQCKDLDPAITFQYEQTPLGTAGAVRKALPHLGNVFAVVYGSYLNRQPLAPLLAAHERLSADITLSLAPFGQPGEKELVLTTPEGLVSEFLEKSSADGILTNLASSGIHICRKSVVEDLTEGEYCDFSEDIFPCLLDSGARIAADTPCGYTRNVVTLKDYLLACFDALSGAVEPWFGTPLPNDGRLVRGNIQQDCRFEGILEVGEGSRIETGCFLENCIVMNNVVIGKGSHLRNALVLAGSTVEPGSCYDDKYLSIIDNG
jgi:NDP-sugar pyrophosphorylase family protein